MSKPFTWSFSRLKNYETCPRRHLEVDINKKFVEPVEPGGALDWGNQVHNALHVALRDDTPIPAEMVDYKPYVERLRAGPGDLYVEQKYAFTRDFQKTSYYANNVWYRGIADAVRINDDHALTLDWKTGKVQVDSVQLMLMAQCIVTHFPQVQKVGAVYVWLKDNTETLEFYTRQDLADKWVSLLPRVQAMEKAAINNHYPPKPSGLCRSYCPVKSCEFYRKGG
jgi:hypothetical protein